MQHSSNPFNIPPDPDTSTDASGRTNYRTPSSARNQARRLWMSGRPLNDPAAKRELIRLLQTAIDEVVAS